MVSTDAFRKLALSFADAIEQPHFERTSFRVRNRIFATLDVENKLACLMLSDVDQSVFCSMHTSAVYPVPNKWGQKGATYFELTKVPKAMLKDALEVAYQGKV